MTRLVQDSELDGFKIGPRIHGGAMASIYSVTYADGRPALFDMVMKVPLMRSGDGGENIVSFEIEHQLLQVLHGPHSPRFVAADVGRGHRRLRLQEAPARARGEAGARAARARCCCCCCAAC